MDLASVLLVDDDLFTRTALSAALSTRGINVLAATDNAADALKNLNELNPEVAIVDLDLGPGPSGIDICHALRAHTIMRFLRLLAHQQAMQFCLYRFVCLAI